MPQITPIAGPVSVQSGTNPSSAQLDTRARAIAILQGQQNNTPVPNPSQVSPEEAGALTHGVNTGQSNTSVVEAPPEAPTPKETTQPDKAPLSSQYAQLARQEKAIRAKANQIRTQEAAIRAREDAVKAKEAEMQTQYIPKDRIAKDPLKVLLEQGYSSDQITQMLLNAPDPAQQQQQLVIEELRSEIKALRDGQETANKAFQDNQTQSYNQALQAIRVETKQLVSNNDQFEAINATNSHEDVVELIEKTFKKDGVLLTVEDAAQAVEDYLVEEAIKIAKLNKIQAKLRPAAPPPAPQQPQKPQTKTLTNTMGTNRSLTAKERAILAFKGELK